MRYVRKTLSFILLMLAFQGSVYASSWALHGQVWSSPYQEGQVYLNELSITFDPYNDLQVAASLPIQFSRSPGLRELQFLYPRLALAWPPPIDDVLSGSVKAHYHPKPQRLELQGGVQMILDPIALRCALSYQAETLALEGSVVFAINERWALGAHLQYTRNSVLTYELHHTTKDGKQRQFSYSHYLDGSLQCLDFRIAL